MEKSFINSILKLENFKQRSSVNTLTQGYFFYFLPSDISVPFYIFLLNPFLAFLSFCPLPIRRKVTQLLRTFPHPGCSGAAVEPSSCGRGPDVLSPRPSGSHSPAAAAASTKFASSAAAAGSCAASACCDAAKSRGFARPHLPKARPESLEAP